MTYDQKRSDEQKAMLEAAIAEFVARYQTNTDNPKLQTRKTLILFPGGMGSQLMRARKAYKPGTVSYGYDVAWLDCSVLTTVLDDLTMAGDVEASRHIVVADGPVDFAIFGVVPYAGFTDWCDENGIDWFIYGWDWRRELDPTVTMFLDWFLSTLRTRVHDACGADPLADFTLVGHSFGGPLVKLIVDNYDHQFVTMMRNAVTVAAPFYGHGGHVHRYFEGDPDIPLHSKSAVASAVSTLPGGYTLLYLDLDTWGLVGDRLKNDPDFPLYDYPVKDKGDGSNVNPYKPVNAGGKFRYPQNYDFSTLALSDGKLVFQRVAGNLDASVRPRFYNIRGVQTRGAGYVNGTICSQTWKLIPGSFNPDSSAPAIVDVTVCPGDGVIPAWSSRHLDTLPENIITLTGDIKHMDMMNFADTQSALASIIQLSPLEEMMIRGPKQPRRKRKGVAKVASLPDLQEFREGLQAIGKQRQLTGDQREQQVRAFLATYELGELRALMSRAFEDALKSPSQKTGEAPTTPQQPPGKTDKGSETRPKPRKRQKSARKRGNAPRKPKKNRARKRRQR